jgi:hypothetical protein
VLDIYAISGEKRENGLSGDPFFDSLGFRNRLREEANRNLYGALPYRPVLRLQGSNIAGFIPGMCAGKLPDWCYQGDPRGDIRVFSAKSRRNLMQEIGAVCWEWVDERQLYTLCLTYPAEWPDVKTAKAHLQNLHRELGDGGIQNEFIWKMEFQGRGAPHFHVLGIFGADYKNLRRRVIRVWYRLVKNWCLREKGNECWERICGDFKRYLAWDDGGAGKGVVACVPDIKKTAVYLSNYYTADRGKRFAKEAQHRAPEGVAPGRYWGVRGKGSGLLPRPCADHELTLYQYMSLRRVVRRYMKKPGRRYRSGSFGFRLSFLNDADQIGLFEWVKKLSPYGGGK